MTGPGAAKLTLVGPAAAVLCSDVTPSPRDDATQTAPGFVIFNEDVTTDMVRATVSVKGWEAHTSYPVRLIQGAAGDCFTVDGVLTTNRQGNGTLTIEESAVGAAAQVIIDTSNALQEPTYRATDRYLLQS